MELLELTHKLEMCPLSYANQTLRSKGKTTLIFNRE